MEVITNREITEGSVGTSEISPQREPTGLGMKWM